MKPFEKLAVITVMAANFATAPVAAQALATSAQADVEHALTEAAKTLDQLKSPKMQADIDDALSQARKSLAQLQSPRTKADIDRALAEAGESLDQLVSPKVQGDIRPGSDRCRQVSAAAPIAGRSLAAG